VHALGYRFEVLAHGEVDFRGVDFISYRHSGYIVLALYADCKLGVAQIRAADALFYALGGLFADDYIALAAQVADYILVEDIAGDFN